MFISADEYKLLYCCKPTMVDIQDLTRIEHDPPLQSLNLLLEVQV
jgi:hypothetical protein